MKYPPRQPPAADAWADKRAAFWMNVNKTDGCWLWTGRISGGGYGRFSVAGKDHSAHRLSMMDAGVAIPDGMVADHICRVRNCVNPAHLRAVTQRINTLENSVGIIAVGAVREVCINGHPFTPENTKIIVRKGQEHRHCRACKTDYTDAWRDRKRIAAIGMTGKEARVVRNFKHLETVRACECGREIRGNAWWSHRKFCVRAAKADTPTGG